MFMNLTGNSWAVGSDALAGKEHIFL